MESDGKQKRYNAALRRLRKGSGAAIIIRNHRIIGYRMTDGSAACLKVRFRSADTAHEELLRIAAATKGGVIPVRYYRCEFCRGWHLTSRRAHTMEVVTE